MLRLARFYGRQDMMKKAARDNSPNLISDWE